jgi:hypothetical protein
MRAWHTRPDVIVEIAEERAISSPELKTQIRGLTRLPLLIAAALAVFGLRRIWPSRRRRRPTGGELMTMSDADFAAFIASSGLQTVSSAGLVEGDAG